MKRQSCGDGQSLIEILIATSIIAVVLVGVSDLITRSLSLANFQASKTLATNIAENQLNYYRQAKDQSPATFFLDPNPQNGFSTCVGNPDPVKYACSIIYDSSGVANGTNMTVTVVWNDGDKVITTQLSQTLAKPSK